jgi:hypothetical protein
VSTCLIRYEGLRRSDFEEDLMPLLRSNFEAEAGPYRLRVSSLMYNTWVEQAGGRIKGSTKEIDHKRTAAATRSSNNEEEDGPPGTTRDAVPEDDLVVPLWLLKQSNEEQVTRLAVQAETGEFSRLILDVGGSRDARRKELEDLVARAISRIEDGAASAALPPMSSYERKIVHDIASERGFNSESEGEGRKRHTVLRAN